MLDDRGVENVDVAREMIAHRGELRGSFMLDAPFTIKGLEIVGRCK